VMSRNVWFCMPAVYVYVGCCWLCYIYMSLIYGEYLVNVHSSDIPHTFIPHFTLHSAEKNPHQIFHKLHVDNFPHSAIRIPQNTPSLSQIRNGHSASILQVRSATKNMNDVDNDNENNLPATFHRELHHNCLRSSSFRHNIDKSGCNGWQVNKGTWDDMTQLLTWPGYRRPLRYRLFTYVNEAFIDCRQPSALVRWECSCAVERKVKALLKFDD